MPSLSAIRAVTGLIDDSKKQNFECDSFAHAMQTELGLQDVNFTGKLLAFRRGGLDGYKGRKIEHALGSNTVSYGTIDKLTRAYPKVLAQGEHDESARVVGNQTHFWTEVIIDRGERSGETYCFDNNHPDGIVKDAFYRELDFVMEQYLPAVDEGGRDTSIAQYHNDEAHAYHKSEAILSARHLLLVDVSVERYRATLKDTPNWQYEPTKLPTSLPYTFIDTETLVALRLSPVDETPVETPLQSVAELLASSDIVLTPEAHMSVNAQHDLQAQLKAMRGGGELTASQEIDDKSVNDAQYSTETQTP